MRGVSDPTTPESSLFDIPNPPGLFVNPRCIIHEQDGLRVAMVSGVPFHTWPVGDTLAENLFVAQVRQMQIATVGELAIALGRSERMLFHAVKRFSEQGPIGLVPKRRGRPTGSLDILRDATIRRLHAGGLSGRAMAKQMACNALTVKRALARMGLEPNRARQHRLVVEAATPEGGVSPEVVSEIDAVEAPSTVTEAVAETPPAARVLDGEEPVSRSFDIDPLNRSVDRFLASQGELTDAAPLFAAGENLAFVGILLAIPGLVQSGLLLEARRLYGNIGPAFYGLRTSLVAIVLLSLLRLKRPENLKEFAPAALGRVLGLDRVPEVKTLRRKLHRLAEGPSETLIVAVAQRRAALNEDALGWLYVDGHVRVYNGKERLPMAHVTRMRISMQATQDMWVHDGDSRPLLFVTQEAHPSLAAALVPVLEASREIVGDRRVTLVFDRGGWSPELFAQLGRCNADVLTYRKGKSDPIPEAWFVAHPGRANEPDWLLHDASVRLPNGLWMRQITRLGGSHQTAIVTTRQDLPAHILARRMFDRWKQENFFKYMRQEFDLDGLCEYGAEDEDPMREAPNPEWTRRNKALRKARDVHEALRARQLDGEHPEVVVAAARMAELKEQRNAVKQRMKIGDLETPTVRLPARVKNLYDGLKTLAWQIETDLFRAVTPHYRRSDDEGRTLVTAALRSAGSLHLRAGELVVTLAPQSSPHRTRAVAELCRILDETATCFPGTRLRLRYRIEGVEADPDGLATANSERG